MDSTFSRQHILDTDASIAPDVRENVARRFRDAGADDLLEMVGLA